MQCKNCGFLVPQNLRFSIMKNFCPQCGEKLFTDKEMNHISMIQSRVLSQDFSSDFDEQTVYDVALFIYNEVSNGFGRIILDDKLKEITNSNQVDSSEKEGEEKEEEQDLEKIKARIREEEAARVAYNQADGPPAPGEDADDKVKRLKDLHKKVSLKKRNPVVRRIES